MPSIGNWRTRLTWYFTAPPPSTMPIPIPRPSPTPSEGHWRCSSSPAPPPQKPVQYISSNGIFPGGDDAPYLEDNQIDGFLDRMEGGYNQAKWAAERLVWQAASRGLPVCVFRPGNIGHHSATGAVNPNDFLSLIIKACARLGCAPLVPGWFFEMTPVDFLATAITKIAGDASHFGSVYNAVQQAPRSRRPRFRPHGEPRIRVRTSSSSESGKQDSKIWPTAKTTWSRKSWSVPWNQSSRTWPIPAPMTSPSSPTPYRSSV